MNQLNVWFFLGPVLLYLLVWVVYRLVVRRRYQRYLDLHREEYLRRVRYEHADPPEEPDHRELLRRGQWDAEHGPLLPPMEIKAREERHWPVGSAFQGIFALIIGTLVPLFLINRTDTGTPPPSPAPVPPGVGTWSPDSISVVVLLTLTFLVSGSLLLVLTKLRSTKALGGALILLATAPSAFTFLKVENLISLKPTINLDGSISISKLDQPEFHRVSIVLPPFDSGTADPDPTIRCAVNAVVEAMFEAQSRPHVLITGKADRVELKPATKAKYATNWGLAQQRAAAVFELLSKAGVEDDHLFLSNAGPIHTSLEDSSRLFLDRSITLTIQTVGQPSKRLIELSNVADWSTCAMPGAVETDAGTKSEEGFVIDQAQKGKPGGSYREVAETNENHLVSSHK